MIVGLLTSSLRLWSGFLERNLPRLVAEGVLFPVFVFDTGHVPPARWPRHKLARARVHRRLAGCSVPVALARSAIYRLVTRPPLSRGGRPSPARLPPGIRIVRVASANAAGASTAFRAAACDLVCMLNVRILSPRTLAAIGAPVVNVHLSDPRFVRGSQPLLWEVLADRDEVVITAHVATEEVDAGGILAQRPTPIVYAGGLGATRAATLGVAQPAIGDVLEGAIRRYRGGDPAPEAFRPGPLRASAPIRDVLRAERLCRARTRAARRADSTGARP